MKSRITRWRVCVILFAQFSTIKTYDYVNGNNVTAKNTTTFSAGVCGENLISVCSTVASVIAFNDISDKLERQNMTHTIKGNRTRPITQEPGLQFLDIPKGDDLKIHELPLQYEFMLSGVFSEIMGYLLPGEFPIDAIQNVFKKTDSSHLWIFQIVRLELLVLFWIVLWLILSLSLPVGVIVSLCFAGNIRRLDEESPDGNRERCTKRTLERTLHLLLIIMLFPIILILANNEKISNTIRGAPAAVNIIYADVNTFIRNSHMQISFIASSSTDITIEAIKTHLEDAHTQLGVPYQKHISSEMDFALHSLDEIKTETAKVTQIVSDLLEDCELAKRTSYDLDEKIQELAQQLLVIQQQCSTKDRSLCFTIQFSGVAILLPLDKLMTDAVIQKLYLIGKEETLNNTIDLVKENVSSIPEKFVQESSAHISDMKSLVSRKRAQVYKSIHDLDIVARTLSEDVSASQEALLTILENIVNWDLWRWIAILVISAITAVIWGLFICGEPSGCGVNSKTVPLLMTGVIISCVICILVWGLATISFSIGGHGKSIICEPLDDHPHYKIMKKFLDKNGILYEDNGILSYFANENDSVQVAEVLKGCQRDQPAFYTFHLYNVFDIKRTMDYKLWSDWSILVDNFTSSKSNIDVVTPELQLMLQVLSTNTALNFTDHRILMGSSLTRRDLSSLADHINTVGRQLSDTVISRKFDSLAFSLRKVVQNEIQTLNKFRGQILYKITKLEVLLPPLNTKVNQSLSHLKTIQFSMFNQASQIAEKVKRNFTEKIEKNLKQWFDYVFKKVADEIGRCRPLWEIFRITKHQLCQVIFDSLNSVSFASHFLIILLIVITPVVLKLVDFYRDIQDDSFFATLSQRSSQAGLVMDEDRIWTSSASSSPEEVRIIPTTIVSPPPRPPTVSSADQRRLRIPTISSGIQETSKLTALTSRFTDARNLSQQVAPITRSRTPRRGHESLRLVEPIHWKSGSVTPRSWI